MRPGSEVARTTIKSDQVVLALLRHTAVSRAVRPQGPATLGAGIPARAHRAWGAQERRADGATAVPRQQGAAAPLRRDVVVGHVRPRAVLSTKTSWSFAFALATSLK